MDNLEEIFDFLTVAEGFEKIRALQGVCILARLLFFLSVMNL